MREEDVQSFDRLIRLWSAFVMPDYATFEHRHSVLSITDG